MGLGGAPAQARFELVVEEGPRRGEVIPIDKPVLSVGRQLANDVVLPDERVSRQHARLEQFPEGLYITDAGSSNGTYVNNVPISVPTRLAPGDVVEVGGSRLVVRSLDAAPAPDAGLAAGGSPTLAGSYGQSAWSSAPPAAAWEAPSAAEPPWAAPPPAAAPAPAAPAGAALPPSHAVPPWEAPAANAAPLWAPAGAPPPADPWAPPAAESWTASAEGMRGGPPPEAVRAGFGPRLAAYLIDGLILLIPLLILNFLVLSPAIRTISELGDTGDSEATAAAAGAFFAAVLAYLAIAYVIYFLYYVLGWTKAGFTPGKKIMKLKIVNAAGKPPGFGSALVRFIFLYLLPVINVVSGLMVLGREKRGLHDRVAGTYVVRMREFDAGQF